MISTYDDTKPHDPSISAKLSSRIKRLLHKPATPPSEIIAWGYCRCGHNNTGEKHIVIELSSGLLAHQPYTQQRFLHDEVCSCRNPRIAVLIKRIGEVG